MAPPTSNAKWRPMSKNRAIMLKLYYLKYYPAYYLRYYGVTPPYDIIG
jgi:hypothetical protein